MCFWFPVNWFHNMAEADFLEVEASLPHRARASFVAIEHGVLRVENHCLLLERQDGDIEIPVGAVSAILVEPGVSVTSDAVKLAAEHGTLLLWVGEAGVRVYSTGMPGGKHAQRLIWQVGLHTDQERRMDAAKRLYRLMFHEEVPDTRSLDKLRGIEGARVKALYAGIAKTCGIDWKGRENTEESLQIGLGIATSCLYGLAEAVILAAGYSPAIGVVHSGDARSLVYDLADTVKFRTVVPAAFRTYMESSHDIRNRVRRACRDMFRENNTAATLFDNLYFIMGEGNADCSATE